MYRVFTSSLQRKPKKSAPCPLCGISFRNVRQHLIKLHKVVNKMELRILLQYTSGTYNGLSDCPICKRSNFVRLDKHMKLCHSDMTEVQQKELLMEAKKQTNLLELKTLRATNPSHPLVSTLDVEMLMKQAPLSNQLWHRRTSLQTRLLPTKDQRKETPERGRTLIQPHNQTARYLKQL
ncbi:hypothetical protein PDJAM_G00259170 [Pangasius djambal]|nr:hypothetical protein [Pangasius djambal]